jgi:hypothetical protein
MGRQGGLRRSRPINNNGPVAGTDGFTFRLRACEVLLDKIFR